MSKVNICAPLPPGPSRLRDLANLPLDERHRALRAVGITVDADEAAAWDETAGDGLDE